MQQKTATTCNSPSAVKIRYSPFSHDFPIIQLPLRPPQGHCGQGGEISQDQGKHRLVFFFRTPYRPWERRWLGITYTYIYICNIYIYRYYIVYIYIYIYYIAYLMDYIYITRWNIFDYTYSYNTPFDGLYMYNQMDSTVYNINQNMIGYIYITNRWWFWSDSWQLHIWNWISGDSLT